MDRVISTYLTALDELNVLTATSYYTANGNDSERVGLILEDVLAFLIRAYTMGIKGASSMLGYDLTVNVNLMEDAIYFLIDGKTFEQRVIDHVMTNDLQGLTVLVESEFHRVYNQALIDGAVEYTDSGSLGVKKTWLTMKDGKVRETHVYLEGSAIPLREEFYTFDGDHAAYPGGFSKAENNVGCRCTVRLEHDV